MEQLMLTYKDILMREAQHYFFMTSQAIYPDVIRYSMMAFECDMKLKDISHNLNMNRKFWYN